MGYLFILLSAVCSITIAHLLKLAEVKKLRTLNTLTANYFLAAIFALTIGWSQGKWITIVPELLLILFCLVVGIFFISNFMAYSKSVHANGVGVTITSMRLSLLVPVLLSVYLYKEYLSVWKMGGVVLVFTALILLVPKQSQKRFGKINAGWLLVIVFLLSGFADASLKIYEEEFSMQMNELTFMGFIFAAACIIGVTACFFRKGPLFSSEEAKLGALIGIPNLYSSIFLIYALGEVSGSVAYPMVNLLNVAGGTALGYIRWGDTISKRQWAGLGTASAAILLLL